jgi:hypothetical protein
VAKAKEMRKKTQRDLFLCHSSEDKHNVVLPFTRLLEARGVSYWFDQAEIKIGDSISAKIDEGLRDSRYVLAFISKSFLERKWPERELRSALSSSIGKGIKKVLPVLIGVTPEHFFKRYSLLSDIRCAILSDDLEALAEEIIEIVSVPSLKPQYNKPNPEEVSIGECLDSIQQKGLIPNRWLRIINDLNGPSMDSKDGTIALSARLKALGIPVKINWSALATPRKCIVANVLLSFVEAFESEDVYGFDENMKRQRGVFIHSFDRPKFARKRFEELSLKAASGCIIKSEWLILLNVPAFFDVGWRDKLSMAPLSVSRLWSKATSTDDISFKEGFNPWIPYNLHPALVLTPAISLTKKLKADLQRFKYAPKYPRIALSSRTFTKSDGLLLHNNGFLVVDGLHSIDSAIQFARATLEKTEVNKQL